MPTVMSQLQAALWCCFLRAAHLWIFGPALCGAAGFTRRMHIRFCLNYHFNDISAVHTKRRVATV